MSAALAVKAKRITGIHIMFNGTLAASRPASLAQPSGTTSALTTIAPQASEVASIALPPVAFPTHNDQTSARPTCLSGAGPDTDMKGAGITPVMGEKDAQRRTRRLPQSNSSDVLTSAGKLGKRKPRITTDAPPTEAAPLSRQLSEEEVRFVKAITGLWGMHNEKNVLLRGDRKELKAIRTELGEQLFGYKKVMVGIGCLGRWSDFLRQQRLPKSTADRYARNWELSHRPTSAQLLSEELLTPTDADFEALVKKLKKLITRSFNAPE